VRDVEHGLKQLAVDVVGEPTARDSRLARPSSMSWKATSQLPSRSPEPQTPPKRLDGHIFFSATIVASSSSSESSTTSTMIGCSSGSGSIQRSMFLGWGATLGSLPGGDDADHGLDRVEHPDDGADGRAGVEDIWVRLRRRSERRRLGVSQNCGLRLLTVCTAPPVRSTGATYGARMANKGKRREGGGRSPTPASSATRGWLVEYHWEAVEDLKQFTDREQKGVLIVADFLRQLGTKITHPHMTPLSNEDKLRELRPGGGKVLVRPLYFQFDERTFKIVAIAHESKTHPSKFNEAVKRAKNRAKRDYGLDI
jgi:hypothetical protein